MTQSTAARFTSAGKPDTTTTCRPKWTIVAPDYVPEGALRWRGPKTKARQLRRWRRGIFFRFAGQSQIVRASWSLEWLFSNEGFAWAGDAFLQKEIGMSRFKLQAALRKMTEAGAIARVHVLDENGQLQRRIFPLAKIIESAPVLVEPRARSGRKPVPEVGTYKTYYNKQSDVSPAQFYARKAAELNAERSRRACTDNRSEDDQHTPKPVRGNA